MAKRFIGGADIVSEVAPAGSITAFAGAVAPDGWMICDGTVLNEADYPALATALAGAWDSFAHPVDGTPSVGVGQFALPNIKGLYLAGVGNAGGDARTLGSFQSQKTAKNGLSNASSSVSASTSNSGGSKSKTPQVVVQPQTSGGVAGGWSGHVIRRGSSTSGETSDGSYPGIGHTHSVTVSGTASAQTITGDNETRPVTAPVTYIIKY